MVTIVKYLVASGFLGSSFHIILQKLFYFKPKYTVFSFESKNSFCYSENTLFHPVASY